MDGLSVVLGGDFKGVGKQAVATPFVLFSYYAVGLPLAALCGFHLEMGRQGPLLGYAFGDCSPCYMLLLPRLAAGLEFRIPEAAARVGISKTAGETTEHLISHDEDKSRVALKKMKGRLRVLADWFWRI